MEEIISLERCGWQALSTGPAEAQRFHEDVLADEILRILPGGLVLSDRTEAVTSTGGPPWASYDLSDVRVLHPTMALRGSTASGGAWRSDSCGLGSPSGRSIRTSVPDVPPHQRPPAGRKRR